MPSAYQAFTEPTRIECRCAFDTRNKKGDDLYVTATHLTWCSFPGRQLKPLDNIAGFQVRPGFFRFFGGHHHPGRSKFHNSVPRGNILRTSPLPPGGGGTLCRPEISGQL